MRTDDIESVVKRAGTEGTTIIQDVAQAPPGHKLAFIMAPENTMIKVSEA